MDRRTVLKFMIPAISLIGSSVRTHASPTSARHIVYFNYTDDDGLFELFSKKLSQLDLKGQDFKITKWVPTTDTGEISKAMSEIVSLSPDVIVTFGSTATFEAKRLTQTIPVVFVSVADASNQKIVESLRSPGGNMTGSMNNNYELIEKRIAIFPQITLNFKRIAVVVNTDDLSNHQVITIASNASKSIGIDPFIYDIKSPGDVEGAFDRMVGDRIDGVYVAAGLISVSYPQLAERALKARLPTIGANRRFALSGGLLSLATKNEDLIQIAAVHVQKILNGAKPSDIPVQRPTGYELVINSHTAKALGVDIPTLILAQADTIID